MVHNRHRIYKKIKFWHRVVQYSEENYRKKLAESNVCPPNAGTRARKHSSQDIAQQSPGFGLYLGLLTAYNVRSHIQLFCCLVV